MAISVSRLRVLFADHHFLTRMGLRAVLAEEHDIDIVGEAVNVEEAITLCRGARPDVVIIDLRLPSADGADAIWAIRSGFSGARVVVLTVSGASEDVYRALHAGARAYLLKGETGPAIVQVVRDVAAGRRVVPGEVAASLAERMPQAALSPREVEVLRLAASGKSNKRIAGTLGLSEATVRTHMSHIMAKLGADDRTHAATEALRRGIL